MSDHVSPTTPAERDDGFTLPELLVTFMIIGSIIAVLASSLIVLFHERPATEGRLNVARAEQTIGMWVPADLASAVSVNTDPAAKPCGSSCPSGLDLSGSNAMQLEWVTTNASGATVTTRVSYHFSIAADGTYQLSRVECESTSGTWNCTQIVVLRDLPGPPGGEAFVPGVTEPDWVILVSEPLAADATSADQIAASGSKLKNAKRVVVTINGGGATPGAGGGINQISITAGGTTRTVIDGNSVQGAPSFADARSRCGGPITLLVDESSSIGTSITSVKAGVKSFITALAGTPVKLQVIGFHTYSHVLGDNVAWHKYWDMTNDSDVTTLLNAVDTLKGSWTSPSGSTNWEEALYRTFYNADGTTAADIPDTLLMFTDGVPTQDRLNYRTSPGILPSKPVAVTNPPWTMSTGRSYSQVGFDRANYIATQFRSSVRFIGVGVGADITGTSTWVSDPGAGYRLTWERGSWSYQQNTGYTYEARYQVKISGNWTWTTKAVYDATSNKNRRDQGWTTITQAQYTALENPANDNSADGVQRTATWTAISTAAYNAGNRTADESDGFRPNPTGKSYTVPYLDWEPYTGARTGDVNQYRSTKVYNSPPYDGYDPAVTASTVNSVILARLIAGNDNGVAAVWNGTAYTNAEEADMYVLPQWSQFTTALEAVALGKCGGTLTLQTKVDGTTAARDPFTYQNSGVKDSSGAAVAMEPTVVTTNQQFTTGTFDFSIPNGQYVTVEIRPENLSDLTGYAPNGWTCRAGITARTLTPVPISGSPWSGFTVKVAANEAVSCILSVRKVA